MQNISNCLQQDLVQNNAQKIGETHAKSSVISKIKSLTIIFSKRSKVLQKILCIKDIGDVIVGPLQTLNLIFFFPVCNKVQGKT